MVVRGAPAIGIAAAYGYALAAARGRGPRRGGRACCAASRPTAVNLALGARRDARRPVARARARDPRATRSSAAARMAAHAAALLAPGTRALTHCNAGGLATGGYGSAVGALLAAWERGLLEHVWVDETRPLLQGARLTAWELETARHPARRDRRLCGRVADGGGRGRLRRHRRRPHRGERRHREQDRHVRPRRARAPPRDPVLRRRADVDRRPRNARPAPRSRSRSATPPRSRRVRRRATLRST